MEKLKNDSRLFENDCETEVAHVSKKKKKSHIQTLFESEHVSTSKVNTVQIDAPGLPDPGSDRMEQ